MFFCVWVSIGSLSLVKKALSFKICTLIESEAFVGEHLMTQQDSEMMKLMKFWKNHLMMTKTQLWSMILDWSFSIAQV